MSKSTEQQIKNYEQGAGSCRAMQKGMQAAGNHDVARQYREAADANLDRVNELKGRC